MSDGAVGSDDDAVVDIGPRRKARRVDGPTSFAVALFLAPADAALAAGRADNVLWYGVLLISWQISRRDPTNALHQQAIRRAVRPGSYFVDCHVVEGDWLAQPVIEHRAVVPLQVLWLHVLHVM